MSSWTCRCEGYVRRVSIVSGRRCIAEKGIILGIEKFSISHSIYYGEHLDMSVKSRHISKSGPEDHRNF